jgi:N-acetylglutamate synthase
VAIGDPKQRSFSSKLRIREFRVSDYDQVISLWLECRLVRNKKSVSKEMLQVKSKRDPQLFLVCLDSGGNIVGTVMGAWDGWRGWIYKLAVTRSLRRSGLGSRLIEEITKRLNESGAGIVRAIVKKNNAPSLSLFAKMGYVRWDEVVLVTLGRQ